MLYSNEVYADADVDADAATLMLLLMMLLMMKEVKYGRQLDDGCCQMTEEVQERIKSIV